MRRIYGRIIQALNTEFPSDSTRQENKKKQGWGRILFKEVDGKYFTSLTNKELNKIRKKYGLSDIKKHE